MKFTKIVSLSHSSRNNSLDRNMTPPLNASLLSTASSQSSLSMESTTSGSQNHSMKTTPSKTPSKTSNHHELPSHINAQLQPNSPLLKGKDAAAPDFYIIKVTHETDHADKDGVVLYKSIMLCNNERTPTVIRNAMMKLGLEGDPDKFSLSQVLPEKELMLPSNANVYYAVNTQFNLNFILRSKKDNI
jgi:ral guanine nucleotide dissociation stimulator-like 1